MNRLFALLLSQAAALSSQTRPARAQVGGRVQDPEGRPLPAVPVELWRGDRRVAVQPSAADGSFRFGPEEAAGAVRLSARMLGYSPAQREVSAPASDVVLELASVVVELEGLTVAAAPQLRCPRREDREARILWASVRTRYDHARDTLGISFYARRYDSTGPLDDVGLVDESRLVRSWYGVPGRGRTRSSYRTSPYPYGFPILSSFDPAYAGWRYRDLHATDVGHFLEEEFGARHTFTVLARRSDAVVVGFCPAQGSWKGPSIEGMLTIGRDTSLVKAEWKFRVPRAAEEAGGEVVFVPRGRDPIPLLPAQTVFWRRIIGQRNRYFHRSERFATYEFLPPDTQPVQPSRWLSAP